MAYARYLVCVRERRWLGPGEEVDHADDDRMNDDPGNLQILTPGGNAKKEAARRGKQMVTLVCQGCGCSFERERRQTHLVKGGKFPTSCSQSCAGKVQREAR